MSWKLLGEIGVDYVESAPACGDVRLSYPVLLERGGDGRYLIVDEIGLRKNLTVLNECRTLLVDPEHRVLFDSAASGFDDGYGCLIDGGRVALLRRTTWELLILDPSGDVLERFDLSIHSQKAPRLVTWTPRGTFLIALLDSVYEVDILELDRRGRLLWRLPTREQHFGCPTGVQQLPDGAVLVVDEFGHIAGEADRDGLLRWQFGRRRDPSGRPDRLSNPMGARRQANGERLIADTRNHRILVVAPDGTARRLEIEGSLPGALCSPTFVDRLPDGHLLICDAGNERVLELDPELRVVWQYGRQVAHRRALSFARSVELGPDGTLLVADTGHDRLLSLSKDGREERILDANGGLFWPRCARRTPAGSIVVADGRNSRIVELAPDGGIARTLSRLERGEGLPLDDPHDVRALPDGHLLIADSGQDLVVETDWEGCIHWSAGEPGGIPLRDPHSAQRLADGSVLIADTGSRRLIWIDRGGRIVRELEEFRADGTLFRLNRPRYAEMADDGRIVVVDSGNNRVLVVTEKGELLWELSSVPDSPLPRLAQPRWAQLVTASELLVSDHSNHRILHLARSET
jgi:sugar lactone lactonase YvrE